MFIVFYSSSLLDQFILLIAGLTLLLLKGELLNTLISKIRSGFRSLIDGLINPVLTIYHKIWALKLELIQMIKHSHLLTISIISFFTNTEAPLCEVNSCSLCTSQGKSVHLHIFRKKKADCVQED